MKIILSFFVGLIFAFSSASAADKVNIEKQLIGIVGAVSGTVKTETRELKTGDKIYLNETILAGADSGTQILLLDQSTFTIGSESEVVMDTFIYDPATNDGKIVASVKQGSLKVISGLISKKNPDSLTVEVPEGTLGSRGTEFQTMVSKKQTSTLLIGPGKNNTLGLRPGAVLVGNKLGSTLLSNPYSVSTMQKGKAPGQSKKITKGQLKKFNKKMKALKVAKLEGASKDEKKQIRKEIKKDLKAAGLDKEEIKVLIKDNIQKDKEKKIEKEIKREQKKDKKKENKKATKENNKKKVKDVVRKQTIKKKDGTVIQQVTVINPKTKKFRRLQKITDKDGKVSYKESKGKVKKVKPKKVAKKKKPKKKKVVAKKKTKGNKKKAAAKKKKDNKKKATNNKKNNKKKATNKKKNNKKKAAAKKKPPKKKNSAAKKPKPKKKKTVKKPPPKKKKVIKKPKPKKKVQKKIVKKNKKRAKKNRKKKK